MKKQFRTIPITAILLATGLAMASLPGKMTAGTTTDGNPNPVTASTTPIKSDSGEKLSYTANEVVKMASAGVSPDVIKAYVNNAPGTFNLTADNIIYLHGLNVSSDIITGMVNRDVALREQNRVLAPQPVPATAPAQNP